MYAQMTMATNDLLHGEYCRWCGRHLCDSFLAEVAGAIEKNGAPLFPILCGITVIGAGTFVSHFDKVAESPNVRKVKHP